MALKLKGSTSGFVAIDAPSVAGNNTLTLPENNGSAHQILANDITAGVTTFTQITVSRNGDLTVPGTISIGGTLTYEDVTSVDSVGIVTARGLSIFGNTTGLQVASGISTFQAITGTTGTFTGNVAVSGANITLQDSGGASDDRIQIGASQDLSLYHNGSHSYIDNSGGSLFIKSSNQVYIQDDQGRKQITCVDGAAVELYHGGVDTARLQTTTSGVSVGTLNATGISTFASTVDINGNTTFGANGSITTGSNFALSGNGLVVTGTATAVGEFKGATIPTIQVTQTTNNTDLQLRANSTGALVRTASNTPLLFGTNQVERMRIDSSGRVMIGDSDTDNAVTDSDNLVIGAASGDNGMTIVSQSGNYNGSIRFSDGANSGADSYRGTIQYYHGDNYMRFYTNASERLRITSDGYVHLGSSGFGTNKVGGQNNTGQDFDPIFKIYNTTASKWLMHLRQDTNTAPNGIFMRAGNASTNYTMYLTANDENTPHLIVRGDGKVGIGIADPDAKLMIADLSTPDIGLKYQGTSGNHKTRLMFIDKRGVINAQVANVLQDDGSGTAAAHMEFATAHAGTLTARMMIDRQGRVSIGEEMTTAHAGRFQVIHNGGGNQTGDTLCHFETNANDWIFNLENDEGASTAHFVYFKKDGNNPGSITATNTTTTYNTSASDRTLKKNFESWTEDTLSLFKNINPQKFHFKIEDDSDEKTKGFIAQDMVDKFPEAYIKDEKLDNKYYFNPSGMTVYLMKALQEATTKIETLESEVAALKGS